MNSSIAGLIWSLMMGGESGGSSSEGTTVIKKDEIWIGENEGALLSLSPTERNKYTLFVTLDDLQTMSE